MIREEKRLYLSHIERNLSQLNCISIESLDYANNYCGVVLCFLFKEKKSTDSEILSGILFVIYFVNIITKPLVNLIMKLRKKSL